jgi:hypothetical protein
LSISSMRARYFSASVFADSRPDCMAS